MDAEFIRTLRGEIRGGWEPGAGAICSQTVSGAFGRPGLSRSRPTPTHATNSLLLSLGTVAEEEERGGQEEHATQDFHS